MIDVAGLLLHAFAHFGKELWLCALKAVDRLLFIANGKHGALDPLMLMAPFAGKKLFRQFGNERPLCRRGVLGFIDQNMIKAAIELEQDPGGTA